MACFDMKTNLPQGEWPWGSPSFKSLGPHKIELIFKALSWGFELVITDIDALVLREPFAFMARWLGLGLGLGLGVRVRVRVRFRGQSLTRTGMMLCALLVRPDLTRTLPRTLPLT